MGTRLDDPFVLELTDDQRSRMLEDTGISMTSITATRASLIGMAIAADAAPRGARRRAGASVRLDLTQNQKRHLLQELRTPVASLLLRLEGDVGYHESWTADFPAFRLRDRLWVTRPRTDEPPTEDAVVVRLLADNEDRGVFGTGRHQATQITARLLEEWIEPGAYVADIGVGSGILTIAALRLGAARVLALDVDEASIARARQNVAINDVSDRVLAHRQVDTATDGPFDLVIANIFSSVLLQSAPAWRASCARGASSSSVGWSAGVWTRWRPPSRPRAFGPSKSDRMAYGRAALCGGCDRRGSPPYRSFPSLAVRQLQGARPSAPCPFSRRLDGKPGPGWSWR